MKKKRIETDVLCIGGGIAGLVAAIRAAECSATAKSGNGNSLGNVLMGNSVSNILMGHKGNDALFGREGDDSLFGGPGVDILDGGVGNDQLRGEPGNDTYLLVRGMGTI